MIIFLERVWKQTISIWQCYLLAAWSGRARFGFQLAFSHPSGHHRRVRIIWNEKLLLLFLFIFENGHKLCIGALLQSIASSFLLILGLDSTLIESTLVVSVHVIQALRYLESLVCVLWKEGWKHVLSMFFFIFCDTFEGRPLLRSLVRVQYVSLLCWIHNLFLNWSEVLTLQLKSSLLLYLSFLAMSFTLFHWGSSHWVMHAPRLISQLDFVIRRKVIWYFPVPRPFTRDHFIFSSINCLLLPLFQIFKHLFCRIYYFD